jgi:hypothetical protein
VSQVPMSTPPRKSAFPMNALTGILAACGC